MKKLIIVFLSCVFFTACASFSGGPAGGPVDMDAPILVYSSPQQGSRNVKLEKIALHFDEYILLKGVENIVVSPPLKTQYSTNLKELKVLLMDTLKENTTYTISFNGAVVDLNEENSAEDLRLVFSTGETLDSMYMEGMVYDALSLEAMPNLFVALYSQSLDSFPFKNTPDYVSKTDPYGYFWVQNIPNTCYKVIAFDDKNKDMILDPVNERISFSSACVEPKHLSNHLPKDTMSIKSDSADVLELYLYQDRIPSAFLQEASFSKRGAVQLKFRYPIDTFTSRLIVDEKELKNPIYVSMAADKKSADLLWSDLSFNKARLILSVEDNMDTVDLLLPPTSTGTQIKIDTAALFFTANTSSSFLFTDTLRLQSSNPIVSYQKNKVQTWMFGEQDSTLISSEIEQTGHSDFKLILPLSEEKRYKILIDKASFTDIYGKNSDTIILDLTTNAIDRYGSLTMQILNFEPTRHYLFQRMDDKNKVLSQEKMPGDGKIMIPYVLPGNYKFRLIEDANNNGRWDDGDYVKNIQPEKVFYYSKTVPIERDWIVEEKWLLK